MVTMGLSTRHQPPKYCRFCAESIIETTDLPKILRSSQYYFKMIEIFSPKHIDVTDRLLPKTACDTCYATYETINAFYDKVKQSQCILRQIYCITQSLVQDNSLIYIPQTCPGLNELGIRNPCIVYDKTCFLKRKPMDVRQNPVKKTKYIYGSDQRIIGTLQDTSDFCQIDLTDIQEIANIDLTDAQEISSIDLTYIRETANSENNIPLTCVKTSLKSGTCASNNDFQATIHPRAETPLPSMASCPATILTFTTLPSVASGLTTVVTSNFLPSVVNFPTTVVPSIPLPNIANSPTTVVTSTPLPRVTSSLKSNVTSYPLPSVLSSPATVVTSIPCPTVANFPTNIGSSDPLPSVLSSPATVVASIPFPTVANFPTTIVTSSLLSGTSSPTTILSSTPLPSVANFPTNIITSATLPRVISSPATVVTSISCPTVADFQTTIVSSNPLPSVANFPTIITTSAPLPRVISSPPTVVTSIPCPTVANFSTTIVTSPLLSRTSSPTTILTSTPLPSVTNFPPTIITSTPLPSVTSTVTTIITSTRNLEIPAINIGNYEYAKNNTGMIRYHSKLVFESPICDDDGNLDHKQNKSITTMNVSRNILENNASKNPLTTEQEGVQTDKKKSISSWKDYPWICLHCKKEWNNMSELRSHSKLTHSKCNGFKCTDCDDKFNIFINFIEHVRGHWNILRTRCQYCDMKFEEQTQCEEHVFCHWTAKQKICTFCGEILATPERWTVHQLLYYPCNLQT